MIKPRITIAGPMQYMRKYSYTEYGKMMVRVPFWFWKCEGNDHSEYGSTPYNSYRSWLSQEKQNKRFMSVVKRWWEFWK